MSFLTKNLGVGVNYTNEISQKLVDNIDEFDFIEIYTERMFMNESNFFLEQIIKQKPIVLHGLDLSIGSPESISEEAITKIGKVISNTKPFWYSDHISLTRIEGLDVGHLMPISFNEENVELIVSKVMEISRRITIPFLLENITYYYTIPKSTLHEAEFITQILNKSDCGMLLDLNNLYLNGLNHGYDPYEYLNMIPLDRVVEVHLAGGSYKENMHVDTHATPITREVWDLFQYVANKAPIRGVIIERDSHFEPFSQLIDEVSRAKNIFNKYRGNVQ